jgi:hypothetical protein
MPPRSRLSFAKSALVDTFEQGGQRAYRRKDISDLLARNREKWKLPYSTSASSFLAYLLDKTELREIELSSEAYGNVTRYVWREPSPYAVFLSLKPRSYLCHASAIFLHGLTNMVPEIIYVNSEQTPKPSGGGLTQESLNRAFANKQRQSNLSYSFGNYTGVCLSGKHTNNLGVVEKVDPQGTPVLVTDIERTLIDAVVRPGYAGGLENALQAFVAAKDTVSTNRMKAYLKQLAYIYPYNQSIGFMMSRAGYEGGSLDVMRGMGVNYDFYIDYGLRDALFDPEWRVYYPRWL